MMRDDRPIDNVMDELRKQVVDIAISDGTAAMEYAILNHGSQLQGLAIKAFLAGIRYAREVGTVKND